MKRVLITGATGFVGRHVISPLIQRGYEVHAITIKGAVENDSPARPNCFWHRVDLIDVTATRMLLKKIAPSHLLHFAWFVEAGKYWLSKDNFCWVEASLRLLRTFHEFGGVRAVMAGTCAEYDWTLGYLQEERTPRRPLHPYGVCKSTLFDLAKSYSDQFGLGFAWGRIFFTYGQGEPPSKFVSSIGNAILRNELARCGQPRLIRDYLYVEDVAGAFIALLDSKVEGAVNIASGRPVTLGEIATAVGAILGAGHLIEFGETLDDEPPLVLGDNHRLIQEVGWKPDFTLEQGLVRTIDWLKQSRAAII